MAAHPFIIPASKFVAYSDAFLGSATASTKQLLSLGLPVPASIFLPPATLEQIYQSSPQRQRVIDLFRQLTNAEPSTNQRKVIYQLKGVLATLVINRQLVHTLTDWYHKYLGGGEVITTASHDSNLTKQSVKGNVNLIETILHIWAESLEVCLLKKGHSPQACLTPTGIFIQSQPKVDLSGIIFTNHPQKLTKASLMLYLWKNVPESHSQQPDEVLDLDMRSGIILRRHHQATANKPSQPISITTDQLATIVNSGSRIKQHYFQETSARFIISSKQILFTELPADYQLSSPANKKPRSATKLLLQTSLVSHAKRTEKHHDGIGIFDIDLLKTSYQQLLPIVRDLNKLSPPHQTLLFRPPLTVLNHDWTSYTHFLAQVQNEFTQPFALLPNPPREPDDWLAFVSLPVFHTPASHHHAFWLELATPAMALSLRSIDLNQIGGIVINQPQLLAWATGCDLPNKNSQQLSPHHHQIFSQFLESIINVVKIQAATQPLPVWVEINKSDPLVIAKIINYGCQAILSSASELSTIREHINQAEKEIWQRRITI